jgi:glyoxylase-like metal-dependent hydrolase (beta-lactamase superfamily II)
MRIADHVWMVDGLRASKVYIIAHNNGIVIVDTCIPGSDAQILRYLRKIGYQPHDITGIIITHTHIDHIGSLPALHRITAAPVSASAGEAAVLSGHQSLPRPPGILGLAYIAVERLIAPDPVPVRYILRSGDEPPGLPGWRVVGTPGHTPDHISLYDPNSHLLIAGDAVIDIGGLRPPFRIFTTNVARANRSIALLAALPLRSAAFGHGQPVINDPMLSTRLAGIAGAERYGRAEGSV